MPRSRFRDVATVGLQMWAYLATYEMPNDDPAALEQRVKIRYPIAMDRILGLGKTPTIRLQRAFGKPGRINKVEKVLVWTHWMWFFVPHGTVAFLRFRHPDRFTRGACLVYATFDLGLLVYWLLPTAPPWYAAKKGLLDDGRTPAVRRMMVEYGEKFWKERWGPLYSLLGGNPLAAMPSLHFATSLMAARVLWDAHPVAGGFIWSYTVTLAIALVYLGEHYVTDLVAGGALAGLVLKAESKAAPALMSIGSKVKALEVLARG
jgi:membrane-associated phospholipid phosphatase